MATFVGDMGLVGMALATEDLCCAFSPSTLVVLGIAAGFAGSAGEVCVCDVAVASSVDLYLHRARLHYGSQKSNSEVGGLQFAELKDEFIFPTTAALTAFAVKDSRFERSRNNWATACEHELSNAISTHQGEGDLSIDRLRIAVRPDIREVRLASGELLSAATDFVEALVERGCGAADMEAGGAVMACNRSTGGPVPHLMILRGISDRGNEEKSNLEKIVEPNFFRRACMRNASRFLLSLIEHPDFAALIRVGRRSTEAVTDNNS